MEFTTRAMLGMLLAAVMGTVGVAEETKSPWWKFGMGDSSLQTAAPESTVAAPTVPPITTPTVTTDATPDESMFAWPSIPKLGMSEMTIPDESAATPPLQSRQRSRFGKPAYQQSRATRNSWAQPPAGATAATPSSSPWQSVTNGVRRVGDDTRNAWKKTVDFVTPGEPADAQVVEREPRESWWSRMWGSEEENEGPQTVTEWMAQDRIDP